MDLLLRALVAEGSFLFSIDNDLTAMEWLIDVTLISSVWIRDGSVILWKQLRLLLWLIDELVM